MKFLLLNLSDEDLTSDPPPLGLRLPLHPAVVDLVPSSQNPQMRYQHLQGQRGPKDRSDVPQVF